MLHGIHYRAYHHADDFCHLGGKAGRVVKPEEVELNRFEASVMMFTRRPGIYSGNGRAQGCCRQRYRF